jgi:prevent-host-death family protein
VGNGGYDDSHVRGHIFEAAAMETVSKSVLKAKMLEYFRHVEQDGEELIVTSHGKPVARVIPYTPAFHGRGVCRPAG